jgi:protein-tyrosine phosphatase
MKILMVCLGNICRSPLAEGIMANKFTQLKLLWTVDSAGTSGWHNGEKPDQRAIEVAKSHGINIANQTSRMLSTQDLDEFDLILAMDSSNYQNILKLVTNKVQEEKIKLILNYVYPNENRAVPDPYYDNSFEKVFQLLDLATDKIIAEFISST